MCAFRRNGTGKRATVLKLQRHWAANKAGEGVYWEQLRQRRWDTDRFALNTKEHVLKISLPVIVGCNQPLDSLPFEKSTYSGQSVQVGESLRRVHRPHVRRVSTARPCRRDQDGRTNRNHSVLRTHFINSHRHVLPFAFILRIIKYISSHVSTDLPAPRWALTSQTMDDRWENTVWKWLTEFFNVRHDLAAFLHVGGTEAIHGEDD